MERVSQLEHEVHQKKCNGHCCQQKQKENQEKLQQQYIERLQNCQQYEKQIQQAEQETKEKEQKLLETSTTVQQYMNKMKEQEQNKKGQQVDQKVLEQYQEQKQLLETLTSAWVSTNSIFTQIYEHLSQILQLPKLEDNPASMVVGMQNLGQKLVEFCLQVEELKKQKQSQEQDQPNEQNEEQQE